MTDGPFSESKEVIGGWAILKADTKAEAIRIATEFMELHRKHWPGFEGESELRPMFDPGMGPSGVRRAWRNRLRDGPRRGRLRRRQAPGESVQSLPDHGPAVEESACNPT